MITTNVGVLPTVLRMTSKTPRPPRRNYLLEHRTKVCLTQDGLANLVGVSKSEISNWERHKRNISPRYAEALEPALGIGPGDLFRAPKGDHSLDDLLADSSPEERRQAYEVVRALVQARRGA